MWSASKKNNDVNRENEKIMKKTMKNGKSLVILRVFEIFFRFSGFYGKNFTLSKTRF